MAKLVKLGDKASSFSCPTTGLKIATKATVVKLTPKQNRSKKIIDALKGGHLVHAQEKEYNDFQKTLPKDSKDTDEEEEEEDVVLHTETSLKKQKVDELKLLANSLLTEEDEETEEDLEAMKKDELIEFILLKQEDEEEEE